MLALAALLAFVTGHPAGAACVGGAPDGIVQSPEQCDDGNADDLDSCASDCAALAFCGDGRVQSKGYCSGSGVIKVACTTAADCGSGETCSGPPEECDDGNTANGDGCSGSCRLQPGWICDGDPYRCHPICGDGLVLGSETCDDHNTDSLDGCSATCTLEAGWDCHDTAAGTVCDPICGDGIFVLGEPCDPSSADDPHRQDCDVNCTFKACGNGIKADDEPCDDGNLANGDTCERLCTTPSPGDAEVCVCVLPGCGNGVKSGTEGCDDGNDIDGDGCDGNCQVTGCGNGRVTVSTGEECDDGNLTSDDGCSATCRVERGWDCTGLRSSCREVCGDGITTRGEGCDDGNTADCDGCSSDCQLDRCGDGILCANEGEVCDDLAFNNPGDDLDNCPNGPMAFHARVACKARSRCGDGFQWQFDSSGSCQGDCGDFQQGREACDNGDGALPRGIKTCKGLIEQVCLTDEDCGIGGICGNDAHRRDACRDTCELPACGDGVVDSNEACDCGFPDNLAGCFEGPNSNTVPNACRTNCRLPRCGDGLIDNLGRCDIEQHLCQDDTQCLALACVGAAPGVQGTCGGIGRLCNQNSDCVQHCNREECDAGPNNGANRACTDICRFSRCGDGKVRTDLVCANDATRVCTVANAATVCGPDVACEPVEECDDANSNNNDFCLNSCSDARCGDGVQNRVITGPLNDRRPVEQCDDGNSDSGDGCDANCRPTGCGNNVVTSGETCDDGNLISGDGCDSNCTPTACGNGVHVYGVCGFQLGLGTAACSSDAQCPPPLFCVGRCEAAPSVACHPDQLPCDNSKCIGVPKRCGASKQTCSTDADCTNISNRCIYGEPCDDGNRINGDGCDNNCTLSGCGNGEVTTVESKRCGGKLDLPCTSDQACFDLTVSTCNRGTGHCGLSIDTGVTCSTNADCADLGRCQVISAIEECDDGNNNDGSLQLPNTDHCDHDCSKTACGNGIITTPESCERPGEGACDVDCCLLPPPTKDDVPPVAKDSGLAMSCYETLVKIDVDELVPNGPEKRRITKVFEKLDKYQGAALTTTGRKQCRALARAKKMALKLPKALALATAAQAAQGIPTRLDLTIELGRMDQFGGWQQKFGEKNCL